jgi:hypothetical protein
VGRLHVGCLHVGCMLNHVARLHHVAQGMVSVCAIKASRKELNGVPLGGGDAS